nr:MAG TPA: hypothetical protein [Caudoviricetes sp.]
MCVQKWFIFSIVSPPKAVVCGRFRSKRWREYRR